MTATLLTLLIGAVGFAVAFIILAFKYDTLRDRAIVLVQLATGGQSDNPLHDGGLLRSLHRQFVEDQRNCGRQAEASRRARCPSAPLSQYERWIVTALGDERVITLDDVARHLGIDRHLVGLVARVLKLNGYVTLGAIYTDDGELAGRGYFLTAKGEEAKAAILGRHRPVCDAKSLREALATV